MSTTPHHLPRRHATALNPPAPIVLHSGYVKRLRAANAAIRALRGMGVRVLQCSVPLVDQISVIHIDRNPHRRCDFPDVRVIVGRAA